MDSMQDRIDRLKRVVKVQSMEEAEKNDLVVCSLDPPSYPELAHHFGPCAVCQRGVHWSDSSPTRPPKVCTECAVAIVEKRVPMPKAT